MREIKFRAWDKGNEHMFYASERNGGSEYYFDFVGDAFKLLMPRDEDYPYEVDAIIMQYTGLKDKNGKEIYEGDVLCGREEGDCETTAWKDVYYIVFFREGSFRVREKNIDEKSVWCDYLDDNGIIEYYEVIGNIYENPELLNN